jgi:hypothetical protein
MAYSCGRKMGMGQFVEGEPQSAGPRLKHVRTRRGQSQSLESRCDNGAPMSREYLQKWKMPLRIATSSDGEKH